MRRGFTLVELLAVIVILAIILSLAIPTMIGIINKSKDNTYDTQVNNIISAAKFYISDEAKDIAILQFIGGSYYVPLSVLNTAGYLELPITNPKTGDIFNASTNGVVVTKTTARSYTYEFSTAIPTDVTSPIVSFGMNGNSAYAKTRSTTVTVTDNVAINTNALYYQWTTSTTLPTSTSFTSTFTNGGTITTPVGVTGTYYLWIKAVDTNGNITITHSNLFNLDNTKPVITILGSSPITIPQGSTYTDAGATATDNINGTITSSIVKTSTVVPTVIGTYTVTYNVTDTAGNAATSVVRTVYVQQSVYNFAYTGSSQTFTVTTAGTYKLEVWGAQGGNAGYNGTINTYGGLGGYATGNIALTANQVIYIYIGGQGTSGTDTSVSNQLVGGFNGGGYGYNGSDSSKRGAGGGGSTDIRVSGTALANRVIVAGAGAGGVYFTTYGTNYPGYGGGTSGKYGETATYLYASYPSYHGGAGTQSAGGAGGSNGSVGTAGTLGLGGNAGYAYGYGEAGGGSGYYGGGASGTGMGGGGGSSYIGSLTSGSTIAGNASMTAPSGSAETGHSGNGYARISYVSA